MVQYSLVQVRGETQNKIGKETCADEVELVQIRGGTQYNNYHLLYNLCR